MNQLRIKEYQIRKLLDAVDSEYKWEGIKASPLESEYRNKMEYSFGNEEIDGELTLGLHKRGSFYDIVHVKDCDIVDHDFRMILSLTQMFFRVKEIPFFHKMKHEGILRHLVVRKGMKTGEIMVALVTTSELPVRLADEFSEAIMTLSTEGKIVSVMHLINDLPADVVQAQ